MQQEQFQAFELLLAVISLFLKAAAGDYFFGSLKVHTQSYAS